MISESFLSQIDRRKFLRILSFTGLAGLIYPSNLISSILNKPLSRIVTVTHDDATSGTLINEDKVHMMMDIGVRTLAQIDDSGEAWKSLLPDVNDSSVIAIKVNCAAPAVPSHPEIVNAVVEGLKLMNFGGSFFPEKNIIIYERSNYELQLAGFTINTSGTGVQCFGTDSSGVGYSSEFYDVNGSNQKLSTIVTQMADFIINLSVLKNHGLSGVTLCLKNHYGTCHNAIQLHGNNCDPWIPALNATVPIKGKQHLNIVDGLFGIKAGGPSGSPQFVANQLIMSKDIVATDYIGTELLKENGCLTANAAHHIATAAQDPYTLGTNDPTEMDLVNIYNPVTNIENQLASKGFQMKQNYPNPFGSNTQIEFYTPKRSDVRFTVFTDKGQKICEPINTTFSKGWHTISWDGKNTSKQEIDNGFYIGQLISKGFKKSIIMQKIR
ncbi:MAG: DUF362 domain-containing protein [Bacteroidales bacterium]|nr:DUF362 domain-containing protein [Bacteroidales bacterium]